MSSCGIQGEEATASISLSMDPDRVIDASMSESFSESASISTTLLPPNPVPTEFIARKFHNTYYPVDTQYKLVKQRMCYIAHVASPTFKQHIHYNEQDTGYRDCRSDAPVTGHFFGPAPYNGSINISVPPGDKMHIEILGFEVDGQDDCSGKILFGPVSTLLVTNTGPDRVTRPAIYYRGRRIDAPFLDFSKPLMSNPNGGIYKFYDSGPVNLVTGDNQITLTAQNWKNEWETGTTLPPLYGCAEDATLHFYADSAATTPQISHRGSAVSMSVEENPSPTTLYQGHQAPAGNTLDGLSMFEGSSDYMPSDSLLKIECPAGAKKMSVALYEFPNSSSIQPSATLYNCDQEIRRADGSITQGVYVEDISSVLPTDSGRYHVILATPYRGNQVMRAHRRLWKFKRN